MPRVCMPVGMHGWKILIHASCSLLSLTLHQSFVIKLEPNSTGQSPHSRLCSPHMLTHTHTHTHTCRAQHKQNKKSFSTGHPCNTYTMIHKGQNKSLSSSTCSAKGWSFMVFELDSSSTTHLQVKRK